MQGRRGVVLTPLASEQSPRLGLPPALCPRGRLFSRSPSVSTGVPLSSPRPQGNPPLRTSLLAGWPPRWWVGRVQSAPRSGTSHSHWALRALPWTPAARCPQPLPLLQGGLPEGRHSRTRLRHLPKAEIVPRDSLISRNLALTEAGLNQSAWLHVLKGKCIHTHCSSNHPLHICNPQLYPDP